LEGDHNQISDLIVCLKQEQVDYMQRINELKQIEENENVKFTSRKAELEH
jgi:hypothetical protein